MRKRKNCHACDIKGEQSACGEKHEHSVPLSLADVDKEYKIICNPNPKCFELGMCHGNMIRIIKNNEYDRNIVIAVGDSRYIVSRNVADCIMVEPGIN